MTRARLSLVATVIVVLQTSIFASARVDGVAPELPLLAAALAGHAAGADRGAWFGFGSGLLYDVMLPGPFGLAALAGAVIGWLVGILSEGLIRSSWWTATVLGAAMTSAGVAVYAVAGEVFGERYVSLDLLRVMGLVGLMSLMIAPAASLVMRWCYRPDSLARAAAGQELRR